MDPQPTSYTEIITQEDAWQEAVQNTLQKKTEIDDFFSHIDPSEIFFLGCTSPYYAGTTAAAFWRAETGLAARACPSSELVLYPSYYYSAKTNPVLIALSRSGKTTETIWAMEEFERRFPGHTILIGCNPEGPLAKMADVKVILPRSAEQTIAQTRSLSSMLLSALMMAVLRSGNQQLIDTLKASPARVHGILQAGQAKVKTLLEGRRFHNVFFLGGGPLYGIALEAGLKCMEMSSTDTFSYTFLESRHGPRAIIDENSLVVGLYSRGGLRYEAALMEELTTRHRATTLAVTPEDGWETGQVTETVTVGCDWPDGLVGLAYLPVIQLVAYYCAFFQGLNPDVARFHAPYVEIKRF